MAKGVDFKGLYVLIWFSFHVMRCEINSFIFDTGLGYPPLCPLPEREGRKVGGTL
jgi:hypothetical protein